MTNELYGGKLSGCHYYRVEVPSPMAEGLAPYTAECADIIEALDMTFNEGEAFKALWRLAAGRQGRGKPGGSSQYDADKVAHYGARVAAHSPLLEGRDAPERAAAYLSEWLTLGDMVAGAQRAEARDLAAMIAKRAELLRLSHLEDTDGNVVLMYTDHVNWDEAPEWAAFLAIDSMPAPGAYGVGPEHPRAYWFEYRPEWRGFDRYWASGGQGGRIQYAPPYSGQGGDPRLFVRATG